MDHMQQVATQGDAMTTNHKIIRVIVESPYAGDIDRNVRYVRACMRDCLLLLRGESPFASHALYTQEGVLRDDVPEERMHGISAGFAWREAADKLSCTPIWAQAKAWNTELLMQLSLSIRSSTEA